MNIFGILAIKTYMSFSIFVQLDQTKFATAGQKVLGQ